MLLGVCWYFKPAMLLYLIQQMFYLFIYFLTSFLEYNCFTMVCQFLLYNKVNQLYIYIYPHISSLLHLPPTLHIPPLQVVTKHQADLPVLCGCFPLAIYFTFGSVYMSSPIPLLGIYSETTIIQKESCTTIFIAVYLQQPGHGSNLNAHRQMNG